MNKVGSVAGFSLAFIIIQYFVINEGVSVTFYFKFFKLIFIIII